MNPIEVVWRKLEGFLMHRRFYDAPAESEETVLGASKLRKPWKFTFSLEILGFRKQEIKHEGGEAMRSVEEATVLITGATAGLGRRVAQELAARGATVVLHGRSEERAEAAVHEICQETGNRNLSYLLADLASLEEVNRLAGKFMDRHERLDVLVNNAGVGSGGSGDGRVLSRDGYELRFAVNYLAHFLLTNLLLDCLEESAPSRIVNVASIGQAPIDFEDVMLERGYDGHRAYGQSKLAQIMFTFTLAERLQGTGVTANALHPASLMDTRMVRESYGYTLSTVEEGADATVRLAISPELEGVTGRFFDRTREAKANEQAYDPRARERLQELSEDLCGPLLSSG
jgi:NAD(P)-dependent dehydrogenase (short-subunit alcohol dehydrogenase family)